MENNQFDILAPQKEQIISEAITKQGINLTDLKYIKEHSIIKYFPDGRQIFCFENQELIEFYPAKVKQINEADRMILEINSEYWKLY